MDDKLYQFVCRACGRELAWALSASSVYCPSCRKWTSFGNIQNPKFEMIEDPELRDDEFHEQIAIFR